MKVYSGAYAVNEEDPEREEEEEEEEKEEEEEVWAPESQCIRISESAAPHQHPQGVC